MLREAVHTYRRQIIDLFTISAIFEGALVLPGKYYGNVVTQGANSWFRGKIEFSSYVNKTSLNPVFGNFQRSLEANFHFTVYIYSSKT